MKTNARSDCNVSDGNKRNDQLRDKVSTLVAHFNSGSYVESESIALEIIQKSPEHILSWKILSVVFALSGRLKESLEAAAVTSKHRSRNIYHQRSVKSHHPKKTINTATNTFR